MKKLISVLFIFFASVFLLVSCEKNDATIKTNEGTETTETTTESIDLTEPIETTNEPEVEETLVKSEIIMNKKNIYKGTTDIDVLYQIARGGYTINHYYSTGRIKTYSSDSANNLSISSADSDTIASHIGKRTVLFIDKVNNILFDGEIYISCPHMDYDEEVIPPTCKDYGYTLATCKDPECGMTFKRDFLSGDHKFEWFGYDSTCTSLGLESYCVCKYCGIQFGSKDNKIPMKPHKYHYDETTHYCDYNDDGNIDHYGEHRITVSEEYDEQGNIIYKYTCKDDCGYEKIVKDTNIFTSEKITKPMIFVTDGYYLEENKTVDVYVEMLNNPGYKSAGFGIRYTGGLDLLGYEINEKMLPNSSEYCRIFEIEDGLNLYYLNGGDSIKESNQYLIKLTFNVLDSSIEQKVNVTYDTGTGIYWGFIPKLDDPFEPYVIDGTIRMVNHLPGDVNGDNKVNEDDVDFIITKPMYEFTEEQKKYSDVNLNGCVDFGDAIWIESILAGTWGINLVAPNYQLHLNYNGYENSDSEKEILDVHFYDDNFNVSNWIDILGAKYKNLSREGYTFLGWYDRLEGGNLIIGPDSDDSTKVKYFDDQIVQTLYAHWQKN